MEKVEFIDCENENDIIVSLSCSEGGKFGVEGFTVQRNPELDFALRPHERGASIFWGDDDIIVLLDKVHCTRAVIVFETRGKYQKHKFDISGISDKEFKTLKKHLKLINFDNSFALTFG